MLRRCLVAFAFVLGACGTAETIDGEESTPTALPTVPGVGVLPDAIPVPTLEGGDDDEPPVSVVVTRPVDDDGVVVESVAERVNGNRLLVIGDSILASTATRYGKELCDALNPIGWSVEVDAEPGRFVEFGNQVAEARLDVGGENDDFDAVVIHLGSNYGRDKDAYYQELSDLLFRAAPRPTLLLTVTEYRPQWSEVNDAIRELAAFYDNVTIVDWEKIARTPGVLSRDGLHPGDQGEAVLVELIAVALGELDADDAECLSSPFTDDSAVDGGSGSPSGGSSSGGSSSGGSSSGGSSSSGGTTSGSAGTTGGSTTGSDGTGGTSDTGASDDTADDDTGGGTDSTTGSGAGTETGGTTDTGGTASGSTSGGSDDTGATTSGGTDATTGGSTDSSTTGATTGGTTGGSADSSTSGATTGGTTGGSTSGDTTGGTSGGSTSDGTTGGTSGDPPSTIGTTTTTGGG